MSGVMCTICFNLSFTIDSSSPGSNILPYLHILACILTAYLDKCLVLLFTDCVLTYMQSSCRCRKSEKHLCLSCWQLLKWRPLRKKLSVQNFPEECRAIWYQYSFLWKLHFYYCTITAGIMLTLPCISRNCRAKIFAFATHHDYCSWYFSMKKNENGQIHSYCERCQFCVSYQLCWMGATTSSDGMRVVSITVTLIEEGYRKVQWWHCFIDHRSGMNPEYRETSQKFWILNINSSMNLSVDSYIF